MHTAARVQPPECHSKLHHTFCNVRLCIWHRRGRRRCRKTHGATPPHAMSLSRQLVQRLLPANRQQTRLPRDVVVAMVLGRRTPATAAAGGGRNSRRRRRRAQPAPGRCVQAAHSCNSRLCRTVVGPGQCWRQGQHFPCTCSRHHQTLPTRACLCTTSYIVGGLRHLKELRCDLQVQAPASSWPGQPSQQQALPIMRAFTFLRLSPEMTSPAYQVRPAPPQPPHCPKSKRAGSSTLMRHAADRQALTSAVAYCRGPGCDSWPRCRWFDVQCMSECRSSIQQHENHARCSLHGYSCSPLCCGMCRTTPGGRRRCRSRTWGCGRWRPRSRRRAGPRPQPGRRPQRRRNARLPAKTPCELPGGGYLAAIAATAAAISSKA
jgi:hypothetical protein